MRSFRFIECNNKFCAFAVIKFDGSADLSHKTCHKLESKSLRITKIDTIRERISIISDGKFNLVIFEILHFHSNFSILSIFKAMLEGIRNKLIYYKTAGNGFGNIKRYFFYVQVD